MKLKSRITRLEAKRPPSPWVPPIFLHSVVEPCEHGPHEVGAFAKIYVEGNDFLVWREEGETKENFEARVKAMKISEH